MLNTEKGSSQKNNENPNPQSTARQSTNPPMRAPEGEDPLGNASYELRAEGLKSKKTEKSKGLLCPSLWLGLGRLWFPVHWRPLAGHRKQSPMHRCGAPGPTWFAKIGCRRLRVSSRV
jgi:hypothetical protein